MGTISQQRSDAPCSLGFTLMELLVVVVVLGILGLLLAQITSTISRSVQLSNEIVDSASQTRLAFDRIASDLAAMPRRRDVDFFASNHTSNAGYYAEYSSPDILYFIANVTSAGLPIDENRGVSAISYRIAPHPDNVGSNGSPRSCLIRAGIPIPWFLNSGPGKGFMGLKVDEFPVRSSDPSFVSSLSPVAPTAISGNSYDVLAPNIIRIVVGYQLYPDNLPVFLAGSTGSFGNAQGQIVYNPPIRTLTNVSGQSQSYIDLDRVSAIVVGLVAVEGRNIDILDDAAILTIANSFEVPSDSSNLLPEQAWSSRANSLISSLSGSIPLRALQSVRVFQRVFPITPYPSKGL